MANDLWENSTPTSKMLHGQRNGVVLGGLGTGGFEIWDDGGFHLWQIFNNGTFVSGKFRTAAPSLMPPGGLFFALRVREGARTGLWKLQMPDYKWGEAIAETYQVPELRFPASINYRGRPPFARLDYKLGDCPLSVSLDACTPFILHDLDASAWPVACFEVLVKNTGKGRIHTAVIGSLLNGLEGYPDEATCPHEIHSDPERLTLYFPAPPGREEPGAGSLALSVAGPERELSYCRKWPAVGINGALFWGQFGEENNLKGDNSKVSKRMALVERLAELRMKGWDGELENLTDCDRGRLVYACREFSECRIVEERLSKYAKMESDDSLRDHDWMLKTLLSRLYARPPFFGSVARTIDMAPGMEVKIPFLLAWHYPFHFTLPRGKPTEYIIQGMSAADECDACCSCSGKKTPERGTLVGHRYSEFGTDALAISRAFLPQREVLKDRTSAFTRALYRSTLPEWLCDAITAQFTSFVTNSWYTQDGRFVWWPGSGCCGFGEIGTGFFGTIPLLLFFPEAAKRQLEMVTEFQAEDGRIPQAFAGNFEETTIYYEDTYIKFPMQVYRDWVWTGDTEYLRRMWPRMLMAMAAARKLDTDGDGIPDMTGWHHDYDQWMMFGLGSYMAGHWPVMLKMMAVMGRALGQDKDCSQWEEESERAAHIIDQKLWTGQWYGLYVDEKNGFQSNALLANNLCGEWYARMTGIAPSLPVDRIRQNLRSVYEHNREPGLGLRCGWLGPDEQREVGAKDWLWNVCWLGVEYAVASHLIYEDMVEEGLTVCREGHERHHRQGLRYNHFECGEHYTRALGVWSVLLALQGFEWDAVQGRLTFRPKLTSDRHQSVLVVPTGWGIVEQRLSEGAGEWSLQMSEGQIKLQELRLARPAREVWFNHNPVPFTRLDDYIRLGQAMELRSGQTIKIIL